jgi:hypothetical protein
MINMRIFFVFYLLLIAGTALGSDFERDVWPGEGIPNFSAKRNSLVLHSQPAATSTEITYGIKKGSKVHFDSSKLITKQSVTLRATTEVTDVHCENSTGYKKIEMPDGTDRAVKRGAVVISPGETIEFLQYRAEGYITARYKDMICEVFVMDNVPKFYGLEKQPVVEWWIRIIDENKTPKGWLLVDQSQVNFLKRGF